jgi:hypothetical protein
LRGSGRTFRPAGFRRGLLGGSRGRLGRGRSRDRTARVATRIGFLFLELLEAEFVVFLHLPQLLLHLQDLEVEFLDGAAQLPDLLFESGDARIAHLGDTETVVRTGTKDAGQVDLGYRDRPDGVGYADFLGEPDAP